MTTDDMSALEKLKARLPLPPAFKLLKKPLEPNDEVPINNAPALSQADMYSEAFDNFPSGLAIVSLTGEVFKANLAFKYLTGHDEETIGESFMLANVAGEPIIDFEDLKPLLHYPSHLAYLQVERNIGSEAQARWLCLSAGLIHNSQRQPLFFVVECRDIQSHKREMEALTHQVMHDPLTGLGNRKLLDYDFARTLSLAKRGQQQFALAVIDIDKFKGINDTLGHDQGDYLLKAAAMRIREAVRLSDTVVRLGGDEFILILNEVKSFNDVQSVAKKLKSAFAKPVSLLNNEKITITLSVGISIYPHSGNDYINLFKKADQALYEVKQRGRNDYHIDAASSILKIVTKKAIK